MTLLASRPQRMNVLRRREAIAGYLFVLPWILSLLIDVFGEDAARKGRLRTRYVAPVYENQTLITCARVASLYDNPEGETVYQLDVWCEDDTGKRVTVGEARVHATGR